MLDVAGVQRLLDVPTEASVAQKRVHKALSSDGKTLALGWQQRLVLAPGPLAESRALPDEALQACAAPDAVSALCWTACTSPRSSNVEACLLVGTVQGFVQLRAEDGALIQAQRLHDSPVLSIQACCTGARLGLDDASEDVTLTFADSLVRIHFLQVRGALQHERQRRDGFFVGSPLPIISSKWRLPRSSGPRSDAVCLGFSSPGLYDALNDRRPPPKLLLLTVGRSPAVAGYEGEEGDARGNITRVADAATALVGGVVNIARVAAVGRQNGFRAGIKGWIAPKAAALSPWSSDAESEDDATRPASRNDSITTPAGTPCVLAAALQDEPRHVTSLVLAPRGALAVAGDSLGRVLLLDAPSQQVIRLWKSYRGAQFAWLRLSLPDEGEALLLAIYAPKRGVLEVWRPRLGPRLASLPCGGASSLLRPGSVFGLERRPVASGGTGSISRTGTSSSAASQEAQPEQEKENGAGKAEGGAWMLDWLTGEVWDVCRALLQTLKPDPEHDHPDPEPEHSDPKVGNPEKSGMSDGLP